MIELVRDFMALAGLGLVTYGIWMLFPPAALIVLGGLLLAGAALWPSVRSDD